MYQHMHVFRTDKLPVSQVPGYSILISFYGFVLETDQPRAQEQKFIEWLQDTIMPEMAEFYLTNKIQENEKKFNRYRITGAA